jgi:hypothetical protein
VTDLPDTRTMSSFDVKSLVKTVASAGPNSLSRLHHRTWKERYPKEESRNVKEGASKSLQGRIVQFKNSEAREEVSPQVPSSHSRCDSLLDLQRRARYDSEMKEEPFTNQQARSLHKKPRLPEEFCFQ